ncbi:hypothetical protein CHELA1G11_21686 [Hyphomicrobiales bacterium]|nr:hypothetical protein CHELA1G11_21686 [Hyphomicrobiales bacterium]CAH1695455.1 hypothetical protein CHELA1G2_21991 [Hyphomicrobiales bacterium]
MPQPVVGCDLSRAFIDFCHLPTGTVDRITNTLEAIAAFIDGMARDALVVFEGTSGCDGCLIALPTERAQSFSRVNPRRARLLAAVPGISIFEALYS